MKREMKYRMLAILLTILMVTNSIPQYVFAEEITQEILEEVEAPGEIGETEVLEPCSICSQNPCICPTAEQPELQTTTSGAIDPDVPQETLPKTEEQSEVPIEVTSPAAIEVTSPAAIQVPEVAFEQSRIMDGIKVQVTAPAGVFPAGATLNVVQILSVQAIQKIEAVIEGVLKNEVIENTISFDITILDEQGNEIQPDTSKGEVIVTFKNIETLAEDGTEKDIEVFYVPDELDTAEPVDTTVEAQIEEVAISTDHFTIYTIVTKAGEPSSISVKASTKMDVALAVGPTDVAYNNFEADLKATLLTQGRYIPSSDLNIMAATTVDTATSNNFEWLKFDHSANTALSSATNNFIEAPSDSASGNYNGRESHIDSEESGTKLTFRGYYSEGYADFMLLESEQLTNKSFQFAIKEYFAADALYGIGYFFNSNLTYSGPYANMYAAYQADALLLNGYLLGLNYTANAASGITIYKVTNLKLKSYHHTSSTTINSNQGGCFTAIATRSLDSIYKKSDDLRKFRINVTPTTVEVYYAGFDDTSHTVASITDESAAASFNTSNQGYINFTAQTYETLPALSFQLTGAVAGTNNGTTTTTVPLDSTFQTGGSDFGPMTKYGSHGCNSLTKVELSELSMKMDVVRSLTEVIREPQWRDGTSKFMVNLNEDPIDDFDDEVTTADILNRLKDDDIYYIGWCGASNAAKSEEFLIKNDQKGAIVNIEEAETDTYQEQINAIADTIWARYQATSRTTNDIVLGETVTLEITNADVYNTANATYPNGKWNVKYYDGLNGTGRLVDNNDQSSLNCNFDKAGSFVISYEGATLITVNVYDTPIAAMDVVTTEATAAFTSTSADGKGGTSLTYAWKSVDLTTAGATPISLGTNSTATLTMTDGHVYLVTLTVIDSNTGKSDSVSHQVLYDTGASIVIKPIALFELSKSVIRRYQVGAEESIQALDGSYDPRGVTINKEYRFKAVGAAGSGANITASMESGYNTSGLAVGQYVISLVVTTTDGRVSESTKRYFSIVDDAEAPKATVTPAPGVLTTDKASIRITVADTGGSGLKKQRVSVATSSAVTPASNSAIWGLYQENDANFDVVIPLINGTYYVYWEAIDDAGNVGRGHFTFNRLILETPTNLTWDNKTAKWDSVANATSYTVDLYRDGILFTTQTGCVGNSKDWTTTIGTAGYGQYTFKVTAVGSGSYSNSTKSVSSEVYAILPPILPMAGNLAWNVTSNKKATWSAVANATSYTVKLYRDGTLYDTHTGCTTTEYDYTSLLRSAPAGDYTFTITAIGSANFRDSAQSAQSDIYKVILDDGEPLITLEEVEKRVSQVDKPAENDEVSREDIISAVESYEKLNSTKREEVKPETLQILDKAVAELSKVTIVIDNQKEKTKTDITDTSGLGLLITAADLKKDVDIKVSLKVDEIQAEEQKESKDLIEKTVGDSGQKVESYVDMTLLKQVGNEPPIQISETDRPIRVTIDIPKTADASNHYELIREHGKRVSRLPDLDTNPHTLTAETDCFSVYALAYTPLDSNHVRKFNAKTPEDVVFTLPTGKIVDYIERNEVLAATSEYTVSAGNLIYTQAELSTWEIGSHTIIVYYTDGTSEIFSIIVEGTTLDEVPYLYMYKYMSVGNHFTLNLTGVEKNAVITYSTSKKSVAVVSKDGVIEAVGNGKATITGVVYQNGAYYRYKVRVIVKKGMPFNWNLKETALIQLDTELPVLNVYKRVDKGDTTTIKLKGLAENAEVSYQSSKKSVAAVAEDGTITGKKKGKSIITIKIVQNGQTYYYKIILRVQDGTKDTGMKEYLKKDDE